MTDQNREPELPVGFSLGELWCDHFLAGLACVHLLTGHRLPIRTDFCAIDNMLSILNNIARGHYQPLIHADDAHLDAQMDSFIVPSIQTGVKYQAIRLNGKTRLAKQISMPFAGILFEDPFWATLAAFNIGFSSRHLGVPKLPSNEHLWGSISKLISAIHGGVYHEDEFFDPIVGYYSSPQEPVFSLIELDGRYFDQLRSQGRCIAPVPPSAGMLQLFVRTAPLE